MASSFIVKHRLTLKSLPSEMTRRDRLISGINILRGMLELWNGLVNIWKWIKPAALAIIQVICVFFCCFFFLFFSSPLSPLCNSCAAFLWRSNDGSDWTDTASPQGEVVCFIGLFHWSPAARCPKYYRQLCQEPLKTWKRSNYWQLRVIGMSLLSGRTVLSFS